MDQDSRAWKVPGGGQTDEEDEHHHQSCRADQLTPDATLGTDQDAQPGQASNQQFEGPLRQEIEGRSGYLRYVRTQINNDPSASAISALESQGRRYRKSASAEAG